VPLVGRGTAAGLAPAVRAAAAVLVVGDPQVLPSGPVDRFDVAGTDPRDPAVTVVSAVDRSGSLPERRWDLVVVTSAERPGAGRIEAVAAACRPGGTVALRRTAAGGGLDPVLARAGLQPVPGRPGRRWLLLQRAVACSS
jgi:hypothetical protein